MTLELVRNAAKKLGLYNAVKWSPLYRFFQDLPLRRQRAIELAHLSRVIPPNAFCFDIGANIGSKTEIFLRLKAKKVVAVEPDPFCVSTLRVRFSKNKKVIIIDRAVSDRVAIETFYVDEVASAFNTLSEKWRGSLRNSDANRFRETHRFTDTLSIRTTTLDCLIEQYGIPDVLKLDIEGYELKALQGLSRALPLVFFECNLPEFLDETIGCLEVLSQLDRAYRFNYCIDTTDNPRVRFQLDKWIDYSQMRQHTLSTRHRFMEIYAKSSQSGPLDRPAS